VIARPERVLDLGAGFWNIRGSHRLGGVVDIGTQCSLVRLSSGRYVVLDAYTLDDATRAWVDAETDGGTKIDAILLLHPYHTLHVPQLHAQLPKAKLYGTRRHVSRFPELPWEPEHTEDAALHALFASELTLSVPRGVDFLPPDPTLHFASVLAFHGASRSLHVDDTFVYARMPRLIRAFKEDAIRLHPTLPKALERRAGAAAEFRAWGREVVERAQNVENLCAAHTSVLRVGNGGVVAARIAAALDDVEGMLARHERKYG
jgi:hypothetical protein